MSVFFEYWIWQLFTVVSMTFKLSTCPKLVVASVSVIEKTAGTWPHCILLLPWKDAIKFPFLLKPIYAILIALGEKEVQFPSRVWRPLFLGVTVLLDVFLSLPEAVELLEAHSGQYFYLAIYRLDKICTVRRQMSQFIPLSPLFLTLHMAAAQGLWESWASKHQ